MGEQSESHLRPESVAAELESLSGSEGIGGVSIRFGGGQEMIGRTAAAAFYDEIEL